MVLYVSLVFNQVRGFKTKHSFATGFGNASTVASEKAERFPHHRKDSNRVPLASIFDQVSSLCLSIY